MPIKWIPLTVCQPLPLERVMVKNAIHCWDTEWREALADPSLPSPVLMWSRDEIPTLRGAPLVDPTGIMDQMTRRKR